MVDDVTAEERLDRIDRALAGYAERVRHLATHRAVAYAMAAGGWTTVIALIITRG